MPTNTISQIFDLFTHAHTQYSTISRIRACVPSGHYGMDRGMTADRDEQMAGRHRPLLRTALLAAALVGAAAAAVATWESVAVHRTGATTLLVCPDVGWGGCSAVLASSRSYLWGVPIAWWGLLFYAWVAGCAIHALVKRDDSLVPGIFTVSAVALLVTATKAYELVFKLHAVCPLCIAMYAATIGIVVLSGLMLIRQRRARSDASAPVAICPPIRARGEVPRQLLPFVTVALTFAIGITAAMVPAAILLDSPSIDVDEAVRAHFEQTPTPIEITDSTPMWGNPNGAVVVVEFADFQCPYCRVAATRIHTLLSEYREDVRLYFINYPLKKHPQAELAAKAGICARQRGDFWGFHERAFQTQESLSRESLLRIAEKLGWSRSDFESCIDSEETAALLQADIERATSADVTHVPMLFINGRHVTYWGDDRVLRRILDRDLELSDR